jgi:hypothetical protein
MKTNYGTETLIAALLLVAAATGTSVAYGSERMNSSRMIKSPEPTTLVGQESIVEVDAQGGALSGLRLKAFPLSMSGFNLALEGMVGGSGFARSTLFDITYGAGVRGEFYLSSGPHHAWMISPGVDGYYVPASPLDLSSARNADQVIGQGLDYVFFGRPTSVMLLSPNVDLNWLYQASPHFGFVTGLRVGAAVAMNGMTRYGEALAGKLYPDVGFYIGTRF